MTYEEKKRKMRKRLAWGAGGILAVVSSLLYYFFYFLPFSDIERLPAAKNLMEELVEEPRLKKLAAANGFGGVLPKDVFKVKDWSTKLGVLMWFCYDKPNGKFYLAIEHAEIGHLPKEPSGNPLYVSEAISLYDTAMSVNEFIKQDKTTPTTTINPPPDRVKALIKSYRDKLKDLDPKGDLKQDGDYAYFQNNPSKNADDKRGLLERLYSQDGTVYIRYYFGCDSGKKNHKLRVILFSVDSTGKNILETAPDVDALVVQRSIPPTP